MTDLDGQHRARWQAALEQAERDLGITHGNGIPWYQAPRPHRWHRCQPWTAGATAELGLVERCACGGIRLDGNGPWMKRNQRR